MTATMRAARLFEPGRDPRVELVPVPEAAPGFVRVAVRVCGICGTDMHIIDGDTKSACPVTLGHEISGVVDLVGAGVESVRQGQRVAVNSMIACDKCRSCLLGRSDLCLAPTILGLDVDGGHADFVVVPAKSCIQLPDTIDFVTGALATDAIATPFQAIQRAEVEPGSCVAVFGLGGLGLHAAIILKQLYGATVIGIDAADLPLQRASSFGVDHVVDARGGRPAREVRALAGGGVDAAFDFVGSVDVVEQAMRSLRPGGTCVVVGVVSDKLQLGLRQETLVGQQLTLRGSFGFKSNAVVAEIFELIASGRLDVTGTVTHRYDLDQFPDGLAALRDRSGGPIRVVIAT
jgi:alcohol dehydrogenase, propanol-preferring